MSRKPRLVLLGSPHHVTQRGNNRAPIFNEDDDRREYLGLLAHHAARAKLTIAGYCLMSNHVHLVVIPQAEDSLASALRRDHGEYAQRFNRRSGRVGHLWQNRYYSCVLDERRYWTALCYVERNPVRAGIVNRPEHWEWSSAREHLGLRTHGPIALRLDQWQERFSAVDWAQILETDQSDHHGLRGATRNGWAVESADLQ